MTELGQNQWECAGQYTPSADAMWGLLVAADYLRDSMDTVCEAFHITTSQFSVLRILGGVYPGGCSRTEIARRMIERAPDVTRLVDRLEQQHLVERGRSSEDRRLSVTRITEAGLRLVSQVEPEIRALERSCFAGSLTEHDCSDLLRMCRMIRSRMDFSRSRSTEETAAWNAYTSRPLNGGQAKPQYREDARPTSMMLTASAGQSTGD